MLSLQNRTLLSIIQYLILVLVICVSSIIFSKQGDTMLRFLIIVVDGILYTIWGIWHHHTNNRFEMPIFIEYAMVSALIIFLGALGLGIIRFF